MIGQALGDAAGWAWEHPWHVGGGVVAWLLVSLAVALVAGPVIAEGDRR